VFVANTSTAFPTLAREGKHVLPNNKQIEKIKINHLFPYCPMLIYKDIIHDSVHAKGN